MTSDAVAWVEHLIASQAKNPNIEGQHRDSPAENVIDVLVKSACSNIGRNDIHLVAIPIRVNDCFGDELKFPDCIDMSLLFS